MSIPLKITISVFLGGIITGIIIVVIVIICCKMRNQKHFLKNTPRKNQQQSKNQNVRIIMIENVDDNGNKRKHTTKLEILNESLSMSSSTNFSEVPIMDSLKDLLDKDENLSINDVSEYTPMMDIQYSSRKNRLNRFIRVQLEPLSNKTFNFYSKYKNSKENMSYLSSEQSCATKFVPKTKQATIDYFKNKNYSNYKTHVIPTVQKDKNGSQQVVIEVHDENELVQNNVNNTSDKKRKRSKILPIHYKKLCIHSLSVPNFLINNSENISTKSIKSLPNLKFNLNSSAAIESLYKANANKNCLTPSNNTPKTTDKFINGRGVDQQARRNSFRRKLHNLKKYADESIMIECSSHISPAEQQSTTTKINSSMHHISNNCDNVLQNPPIQSIICQSIISNSEKPAKNSTATSTPVATNINYNSCLTTTTSQELSRELWQLRALLANNVEDLDSEESIPATPYNLENMNNSLATVSVVSSQDSSYPVCNSSCNSSLLESFQSIEETINIESFQNLSMNLDKNDSAIKVFSKGITDYNSLKFCKELIAKFSSATSKDISVKNKIEEIINAYNDGMKLDIKQREHTMAITKSDPDDSELHREPSIRRQTYRNAIARRQAKPHQPDAPLKNGQEIEKHESSSTILQKLSLPLGSETSQDTESSISFERHSTQNCSTAAASLSFEDSNTSTDSTEYHFYKLEKLRGDSGYKSLENQQSLNVRCDCRSTINFVPQESNIISEDETVMSPVVTCTAGSIPILTRRVHSADENLVRTNTSIIPNVDSIVPSNPQSTMKINEPSSSKISLFNKMSHQALMSRNKAAEKKRIQYKCDRRLVQLQDSFNEAGIKSVTVTAPSSKPFLQKTPLYSSGSIMSSSTSSFASSFFSRFLKSHSRRTLVRMQRDYSIDERTDALFNEFLRYDPALEIKHTLCISSRSSPRTRHKVHHTTRHRSTEQPSSESTSKLPIYLATNESTFDMKVKRHDRRQQRFSTTDKIGDINILSKCLELQSYKRFQHSFGTLNEGNSNSSSLETEQISKEKSQKNKEGNEENTKNEAQKRATTQTSSRTTVQQLNNECNDKPENRPSQMPTHRTIPVIQLTEEE